MRFKYTIDTNISQKTPHLESFILESAKDTYYYTKQVLGEPWFKAESVVLTSPKYTYLYAKNVLKKRWPAGEKQLIEHAEHCLGKHYGMRYRTETKESIVLYSKHVIKGRWKEIESFVVTETPYIGLYRDLLKDEKDIEDFDRSLMAEALADNSNVKKFLEWKPTHVVKIKGVRAFSVLLSDSPNGYGDKLFHNVYDMEEWLCNSPKTCLEYHTESGNWYLNRWSTYNLEKHKFKGTVTPLTQK
jgi:hypothetical protein